MGSRFKINLAYIAGFLDGDGSLMLQIKKRKDGRFHYRFMATICFYQDSRHEKSLHWIKKVLGVGYLSTRNDGMSELRINGFEAIHEIMKNLLPYIRFKKNQAQAIYKSVNLLAKKRINGLTKKDLLRLVKLILIIQKNNYATRTKKTESELYAIVGLTP